MVDETQLEEPEGDYATFGPRQQIRGAVDSGFQDTGGAYPTIQKDKQSDVEVGVGETDYDNSGTRGARGSTSLSASDAPISGHTTSKANPEYPYNQVTRTPSGHTIEYDDTPGFERVNIRHRSGSRVTMYSNGDIETFAAGSQYGTVSRDSEVIVRGTCNIIVESNANLLVQGDAFMEVGGDLNQLVRGNHNLEVDGNQNIRVHGNVKEQVTGGRQEETRGNVVRRNLSGVSERTVGNHVYEIGGNYQITVEGTYTARSYGEVQMSYHGGLVTLNGLNKETTDPETGETTAAVPGLGQMVSNEYFGTDAHLATIYNSIDVHVAGDVYADNVDVATQVTAPAIHGDLEGTAKKSEYADTAGAAPDGSASPTSPSADSPEAGTARDDDPTSSVLVTDVTGTSGQFIVNLDRSAVNGGYNTRKLSASEVNSRCRNANLLKDGTWLADQIGMGSILSSVTSANAPTSKRTGGVSTASAGRTPIGNTKATGNFTATVGNKIDFVIPEHMKIVAAPSPQAKLSPNYAVAHMLSGDSEHGRLKAQLGLTEVNIANNMQLLSYNVLEVLRRQFKDCWTISEGIYNPYSNEKLDPSSFNYSFAQGLGVGIQMPEKEKSFYFDMAQWCQNNLVFDKLALSYFDYDPNGKNEPTLIITIKSGTNSKTVLTEFNHQIVSNQLEDFS